MSRKASDHPLPSLVSEDAPRHLQQGALAAAAVYGLVVAALLGVVDAQLPASPSFAGLYGVALLLTEGCTAYLLFGLAAISRRVSALLLACAYLLSGEMALLHVLTFPGAILAGGPLIGGPQAAPILFIAWRNLFPVLAIVATLFYRHPNEPVLARPRVFAWVGALGTTLLVAACCAVALAPAGLPVAIVGQGQFAAWVQTGSYLALALHLVGALLILATPRARGTLGVWIGLAMLSFAGELLLTTLPAGRYSLGWYAGRLSGLVAACLLFGLFLARFARQNRDLATALDAAEQRSAEAQAEILRREEAERRLLQSQKMEALGQLTGGIAHDFNNMLLVIGARVQMLGKSLTGPQTHHATQIEQALARCETLTQQLLSFTRQRPLQSRTVRLQEEMPRIAELLRPAIRGDIRLSWAVAPDTYAIEADPMEFDLALLNAALNARDAMPNGGELRIEIDNVVREDGDARRTNCARVRIADTGCGIAPDLIARVFEPFFTTKEVGRGTGLGLSQIYGFARQCGGTATVESVEGSGTTLTLLLPRGEGGQVRTPVSRTGVAEDGLRGAALLLVEDNDTVAEVVTAMLEDAGLIVRRAATGVEALRLLGSDTTLPDLVLSDIVMPGGVDGVAMARELRRRHPALPIVLSTGYSSEVQDAVAEGFVVLSKPYQMRTLRQTLAEARAGRPASMDSVAAAQAARA